MAQRILVVDPHPVVREGVKALLACRKEYELVGEAAKGSDAVTICQHEGPDVAMLESVLPELNGPDSAREIRRVSPHTRVLAFTERPDKQQVLRMLAAGAKGYLLKSCGRKELLQALDVVVGGGTYLSPQIASIVVEGCMGEGRPITPLADKMSVRERQILQLIAEGRSTKVIASMLCVSPRTIDSHRLRIMSKLNVDSVAGLTKQAINMGLTTLLC